jgi:hypothetical protein
VSGFAAVGPAEWESCVLRSATVLRMLQEIAHVGENINLLCISAEDLHIRVCVCSKKNIRAHKRKSNMVN